MIDQQKDPAVQRRMSPLISRMLIVAFVVAAFVGKEWPNKYEPVFRAIATLHVSQRMNSDFVDADDRNGSTDYFSRRINTIGASLANATLMRQVIADHDLLNNEVFLGGESRDPSLESLARRMVNLTSVRVRDETELIDVRFTYHEPSIARDLANWIAQGFIKQHSNRALKSNRFAIEVLTNEVERLKIKLRNAEVALIDFRRTSNLVSSLENRKSMLMARINSNSDARNRLDLNIARLKDDLNLVASFGEEPTATQLESVPGIWNSESVRQAREMLAEVEAKWDSLTLKYSESHPTFLAEKGRLEYVELRLVKVMQKEAGRLEPDLNRLRVERVGLQKLLAVAEAESLRLSETAVEYNVLEREVEGTKTLYHSVMDRIREIDLSAGLSDEVITVLEPATAATDITPNKNSQLLQSAVAGLVLSLVGILLFDKFPFRSKPNS